MLFPLIILAVALPIVALGERFPVHNDVFGGAPVNATIPNKITHITLDDDGVQLGLRYVENSGFCGGAHSPEY